MKSIALLVAAGALAVTFAGPVVAEQASWPEAHALQPYDSAVELVVPGEHPHHHCHGRASGTAHQSCGTLTGGPSGGLF